MAAAPAPAAAEEAAAADDIDPVLSLLARKPLGSLKWVVVESEELPPQDELPPQHQHQQHQPQQHDRGVPRRPTTPRGPEGGGGGGFWYGASSAATPPRPRSPATPLTAGGSSSHNSSRRVYYLDVEKPARLATDALHQRATAGGMSGAAGGGALLGLGASPPHPMRVLSGGRSASSSSPLAGDGGVEFAGSQGLDDGDGGRGFRCGRSWPLLILLVLVGAAEGALFGLRSAAGLQMGLMVVVAAAVVVGLLVWVCCRRSEAGSLEAVDEAFDEDEGHGFLAGQPGSNNDRRHYGSMLVGP